MVEFYLIYWLWWKIQIPIGTLNADIISIQAVICIHWMDTLKLDIICLMPLVNCTDLDCSLRLSRIIKFAVKLNRAFELRYMHRMNFLEELVILSHFDHTMYIPSKSNRNWLQRQTVYVPMRLTQEDVFSKMNENFAFSNRTVNPVCNQCRMHIFHQIFDWYLTYHTFLYFDLSLWTGMLSKLFEGILWLCYVLHAKYVSSSSKCFRPIRNQLWQQKT